MDDRRRRWSRRDFVSRLAAVGTAGLLGVRADPAAAEPPPETRTIRLIHDPEIPVLCYAPILVAEELLRGEGFTDVRFVKLTEGSEARTIAAGHADMSGVLAAAIILAVEARQPLVALAGLHVSCLEVIGTEQVRTIRDLKGRTVAVNAIGSDDQVFLSGMLATWGSIPAGTSPGSLPRRTRCGGSSPRARSTRWSPSRRSRRSCGPGGSAG
jgi:NitT/TauT family transport system substrate-binding protein